jgi:hypothetical protein
MVGASLESMRTARTFGRAKSGASGIAGCAQTRSGQPKLAVAMTAMRT